MSADSTPEEEVRRLERHYSVNPEGLVFARLADAYRRCGRRERALELLREGLDRHPDYATGHLIEGRTLREEGRPGEAADSFRRVLDLDAENLVALRSLAELATERGDMEEARRWGERLERADPFASFSPAEVAARQQQEDGVGPTSPPPAAGPSEGGEAVGGSDAPANGGPPAEDLPEDAAGLPGEDGLASEIAAMADDGWWGASRGGAGEEDDEEVATETMAHLYAEQGLYEEAAEVYRRLLDRRPGEGELRSRLEEMERRAAGEGGAESGAPDAAAAPEAGRREQSRAADGGDSRGREKTAREHFRRLLRGRAGQGRGDDRPAETRREAPAGEARESAGGAAG